MRVTPFVLPALEAGRECTTSLLPLHPPEHLIACHPRPTLDRPVPEHCGHWFPILFSHVWSTRMNTATSERPHVAVVTDWTRPRPQAGVLPVAWLVTLLVSLLPDILLQTFTGHIPEWVLPSKLAFLAVLIVASFFSAPLRVLRGYGVMLAVLFLANLSQGQVETWSTWRQWFGQGFTNQLLGSQILRVAVAAVMVGVLLVLQFRPREFFLTTGNLNATAAPVRWLGITKPMGWARLGAISSLCISLGMLAFLVIAGRPPLAAVARVLPLLPMVLVLAAMNAFTEEVSFRCALLAPLHGAVNQRQAVLMTGAFFGIAHYYGVPYGIVGVIMASFLGWYLGKCMVETRGLFWPWFIHFLQDVLAFSFMGIGSVIAGGR